MKKLICDMCGREVGDERLIWAPPNPTVFWGRFQYEYGADTSVLTKEYDLCPICSKKIKAMIEKEKK